MEKNSRELSPRRLMGKLETCYLFASVTIPSSSHRCGASNTGSKVSFETVICSMLQTISHRTAAHLSSSYLLATVRGIGRSRAGGESEQTLEFDLIFASRDRGLRSWERKNGRWESKRYGGKEEERDRELTILSPSLFGYREISRVPV